MNYKLPKKFKVILYINLEVEMSNPFLEIRMWENLIKGVWWMP
jgi:hypothetical protein